MSGRLRPWLDRWGLVLAGEPFETPYTRSVLAPVRQGATAAMLKVADEPEEIRGAALMTWWAGRGAARVLAHDGPALLLERATGPGDLVDLARRDDDAAMRILCAALKDLHAPRGAPPAGLKPLRPWFAALAPSARKRGGIFAKAHAMAEELLAAPQDERVLHGDMHHENLLDFGERGWLAIDPKGLFGERGYDYANLFCNPDEGDRSLEIATRPGQLARRAQIASEISGIPVRRLLQWVLAYAGLSASWTLDDNQDATVAVRMAELAAAELSL